MTIRKNKTMKWQQNTTIMTIQKNRTCEMATTAKPSMRPIEIIMNELNPNNYDNSEK